MDIHSLQNQRFEIAESGVSLLPRFRGQCFKDRDTDSFEVNSKAPMYFSVIRIRPSALLPSNTTVNFAIAVNRG